MQVQERSHEPDMGGSIPSPATNPGDDKFVIERVAFVRHVADSYRAGLDEGQRRERAKEEKRG